MGKHCALIVCMVLAASFLATPTMSATYTVGDSDGWALGVDYATWATSKTFKLGDSLVFHYGSSHSVSEVSSTDYSSCNPSNPLSADRSGATTITLNTLGPHYFVCGAPGHCDAGQKLEALVTGDDTAAPPSPAPETPAIASNAPTSAKTNDAPHSSSAASLPPIISTIFLVACVGFLFLN